MADQNSPMMYVKGKELEDRMVHKLANYLDYAKKKNNPVKNVD